MAVTSSRVDPRSAYPAKRFSLLMKIFSICMKALLKFSMKVASAYRACMALKMSVIYVRTNDGARLNTAMTMRILRAGR